MKKQEIALTQLRRSIELYEQEDYICAITLAGASEELLGRMALQHSGTNATKEMLDCVSEVANFFGGEPAPKKNLIAKRNRVRNELKHQDDGENNDLNENFKEEAEAMIDRALSNWSYVFGSDPDDEVLKAYIKKQYQ